MSEFKGTIGRTLADSEPHYMEPPHPGEAAPNVVIVANNTDKSLKRQKRSPCSSTPALIRIGGKLTGRHVG